MHITDVRRLFTIEKMNSLKNEGLTITESAKINMCTTDQVRAMEKETGVKLHRNSDRAKKILTIDNMKLWADRGLTRVQISEITGLPTQTVGSFAAKYRNHLTIPYDERLTNRCRYSKSRKYTEIEKLALFSKFVTDSKPLRHDHGVAA